MTGLSPMVPTKYSTCPGTLTKQGGKKVRHGQTNALSRKEICHQLTEPPQTSPNNNWECQHSSQRNAIERAGHSPENPNANT